MPRKSIGETAMTDSERQARYRAARTRASRRSAYTAQPTIAAEPGAGAMLSPRWQTCKCSMPPGSTHAGQPS